MCLIIEHCRDITAYMAKTFLFDDNERHTGRSKVLLRTTINDVILAHVNRTAQNIGAHISYEADVTFLLVNLSQLSIVDFRTKNGVIGSDMEIISILWNLVVCWDICCAGSHFDSLAEAFSLFECFLGPNTGVQVGCFFLHEVKRHHTELQAGTSAEEEHAIAFRHIQ